MSKDITDLLRSFKQRMASSKKPDLKDIQETLEQLKTAVALLSIQSQLTQLSNKIGDITNTPELTTKNEPSQKEVSKTPNPVTSTTTLTESIENLKEFTTTRNDPVTKTTQFLLHRATEDFEYENSIGKDRSYTTSKDTVWMAEFQNI